MLKLSLTVLLWLMPLVSSLAALKSSYQLIQAAHQRGEISDEERLIRLVQSVKNPAALPVDLRSQVAEKEKCATDIFVEISKSWSTLSASAQAELRQYLARPSRAFDYNSPGGQFKIHYDITGAHAVPATDVNPANGVPDYIDWIADYADSSYRAEVTNMGQLEPPSDGSAGGDSRYDIYTEEMGYYGYAQPESPGPQPWNDYTSYISVHRNFLGFPANDDPDGDQKGAAKVTVAHEYYHAIQFSYDAGEQHWFMEISSTWMEDHVYDVVNDNYNYLSTFFVSPYVSLHLFNGSHEYSSFIWGTYLTANFGVSIMPEIWNDLKTSTGYTGISNALATYGANLNDQFAGFTAWNFVTNTYDDNKHYEEADRYPLMSVMRTHSAYPVVNQSPVSGKFADAMSSDYVIFLLPTEPGELTVEFNGDNSTPWKVKLLAWTNDGGNAFGEYDMPLNGSGDGSFTLTDTQNWKRVILIMANVSQSLNDRSFLYSAGFTPVSQYEVQVSGVADDSVYSNTASSAHFQIQNTGVLPDTFSLGIVDDYGWTMYLSAAKVYLAPGEQETVSVTLNCPPLTMEGVLDRLQMTATGISSSGVTGTDTINVRVFVMRGDATNNGIINIADVTYDVAYIFNGGPSPLPMLIAGDANCQNGVNIADIVYIIQYIFNSGPPPPCNLF